MRPPWSTNSLFSYSAGSRRFAANATSVGAWLLSNVSPALRIASVPVVGSNSRASVISTGVRTCCESRRTPSAWAAVCIAFTSGRLSGRPGFHRTVAWDTLGNASLRIAKRFALRSRSIAETPVMFPPGFARLATKPAATGSPVAAITIGIVVVNFAATLASGVQAATITSTLESTSSRMIAASLSGLPSASWTSIVMFCRSAQPSSRRRWRNASTKGADGPSLKM